MYRQTGFGCGCNDRPQSRATVLQDGNFGGFFTLALNAAGSLVGDPALGSQIASQAGPAYARIKDSDRKSVV